MLTSSQDSVNTSIFYSKEDKDHFIKLSYPNGEVIFPFHESLVPVFNNLLGIDLNYIDSIDCAISPSLKDKIIYTDDLPF